MALSNELIPVVEDLSSSSSDSDDGDLLETTMDRPIEEMESREENGENDDLLSRLDSLSRSMTENALLLDAEGDLDDLDSKLKRAKLCWIDTTREMKQECDDTRKNITKLQNLLMYGNMMAMQIANRQARRDGQIAEMDRCLFDVGEELAQLIPEQREMKQKNRELSQQLADLQRKMRKRHEERKRLKHQLDECNIFRLRYGPDGDRENAVMKIAVSFPESDVKWSLKSINDWLVPHQREKKLAEENNARLYLEIHLLSNRLEQLTEENAKLKADIEQKEKCHELQLVQNMTEKAIIEDHEKQEVTLVDQSPADETVVRSAENNRGVGKRKTAPKECLKLCFNILTKTFMVVCFFLVICLSVIVDGNHIIPGFLLVVILSSLLALIINSKLDKYFDIFYDLLSCVATTQ